MITVFDTCAPAQTFLVLYFTTLLVVSFHYFTKPVQPFCLRKYRPDDCGEKRQDYILHVVLFTLAAVVWSWLINIVFHAVSSFFAWILTFLPLIVYILYIGYNFIPNFNVPVPVGQTNTHIIEFREY